MYILVQYISKWLAWCLSLYIPLNSNVCPLYIPKMLYYQFTVWLYTGPVYSTVVHKISPPKTSWKTGLKFLTSLNILMWKLLSNQFTVHVYTKPVYSTDVQNWLYTNCKLSTSLFSNTLLEQLLWTLRSACYRQISYFEDFCHSLCIQFSLHISGNWSQNLFLKLATKSFQFMEF